MQTANETKKPLRPIETPVPCPKCGALPMTAKVRGSWRSRCTSSHFLKIEGHAMRTKREAIHEWNNAFASKAEAAANTLAGAAA
jgi:hypothetical protein